MAKRQVKYPVSSVLQGTSYIMYNGQRVCHNEEGPVYFFNEKPAYEMLGWRFLDENDNNFWLERFDLFEELFQMWDKKRMNATQNIGFIYRLLDKGHSMKRKTFKENLDQYVLMKMEQLS